MKISYCNDSLRLGMRLGPQAEAVCVGSQDGWRAPCPEQAGLMARGTPSSFGLWCDGDDARSARGFRAVERESVCIAPCDLGRWRRACSPAARGRDRRQCQCQCHRQQQGCLLALGTGTGSPCRVCTYPVLQRRLDQGRSMDVTMPCHVPRTALSDGTWQGIAGAGEGSRARTAA